MLFILKFQRLGLKQITKGLNQKKEIVSLELLKRCAWFKSDNGGKRFRVHDVAFFIFGGVWLNILAHAIDESEKGVILVLLFECFEEGDEGMPFLDELYFFQRDLALSLVGDQVVSGAELVASCAEEVAVEGLNAVVGVVLHHLLLEILKILLLTCILTVVWEIFGISLLIFPLFRVDLFIRDIPLDPFCYILRLLNFFEGQFDSIVAFHGDDLKRGWELAFLFLELLLNFIVFLLPSRKYLFDPLLNFISRAASSQPIYVFHEAGSLCFGTGSASGKIFTISVRFLMAIAESVEFLSSGWGNTDGGKLFLSEIVAGMVGKLIVSDVVDAGMHNLSLFRWKI